MGYSSTTREFHNVAQTWKADCPRCKKAVGPSNFPCPNCEQPTIRYVLETHSPHARSDTYWREIYLECSTCHAKLKSFPCPHDCGGVVSTPCISALIRLPRRWVKLFRLVVVLAIVVAFFFAWGFHYDPDGPNYNLDGPNGGADDNREANTAFFIGVPAAIATGMVLGRMIRVNGPSRWRILKE